MSVLERFKIILLWFFSTGMLAVANHFSGNVFTDWAVEGLSIILSIPKSRLNDVILGIALLAGVAAPLMYLIYILAKKAR